MNFLIRGIVVGFSIAAPVGPIGLLCIRRSMAEGRMIGLATGLGAATADAAYGAIAGFGLTAITNFLTGQTVWLGALGGMFLCYLGVRTFLSAPPESSVNDRAKGVLSAYLTAFFLTLSNPTTILSFIAVFAGIGLSAAESYASAAMLVAGVFVGSATWWLILSGGIAACRERMSPAWMVRINQLSGVLILGFGVYALSALRR